LAAVRGLGLFPDNGLIKGILFRSHVSLRKIDEARALLKTWAASNPGLDVEIRRGDLEAISGRYDEAASIFAKYDPLNAFIKTRLPFLMLWEGKVGQALGLARSAGDHLSLIYLNSRAGKFDEALAESEKAIQEALAIGSFSGQAEAFQMRGLAELASGNVPAAERTAEALKRCVAEAPNRRLAGLYHFLLAMIESEAGRYTQAVGDLRKAIELRPAESWTEEGYPCRPHPYDGLAAVYFRSGDLGRAKEEYRRIQSFPLFRLQHGDIYATSFYWLGRIAEEEGKKAEASVNYRKFLDLWKNADPGLPEVEDAKKRINGRI
jgi:tetratricopeptide (TPR) repeat protein